MGASTLLALVSFCDDALGPLEERDPRSAVPLRPLDRPTLRRPAARRPDSATTNGPGTAPRSSSHRSKPYGGSARTTSASTPRASTRASPVTTRDRSSSPSVSEVVTQRAERRTVTFDEGAVGGTTRQRLDPQCATPRIEVDDECVTHQVQASEGVERGLTHLVGGGPGVIPRRRVDSATTQFSGDDTHPSRLRLPGRRAYCCACWNHHRRSPASTAAAGVSCSHRLAKTACGSMATWSPTAARTASTGGTSCSKTTMTPLAATFRTPDLAGARQRDSSRIRLLVAAQPQIGHAARS